MRETEKNLKGGKKSQQARELFDLVMSSCSSSSCSSACGK